ncbi:MAG: glycogen debranching enzyme GlgX, partial [Myxococcales bacterium]|nr:glycogen debranching enzyme GlgX [Myxococcales bacterium]
MRAVSGVAWVGEGRARFAVDTTRAARVLLHLFSGPDGAGQRVIELAREDRSTFAVTIDDVRPGTLYGYRVYGPAATEPGDRFDPGALLVDPRALAIHGALDWATTDASQRAAPGAPVDPRGRPLGVVVGPLAPLDASRPRTPIADTVIYEVHVKGATQLHPDVPASQRGTYQGLAHPAMIEHLRSFGVTAVELLPVQEMIDERALVARGLRNYWGYNPIGLFAPAGRYAAGGARGEQVAEFRAMVAALHRAGLEVILDVVFNHTAEGSARGPTLSLRGLDNAGYYLLDPGDPRRYLDCSGCGNSLDFGRPLARALVRDCLRHWVVAMGVDGFRL